jgi:hypothetical protein
LSSKPNPRRIPRTKADADRAHERGREKGINGALVLFLYTRLDKFGATDDELKQCRNELCLRCGEYKMRHMGVCVDCIRKRAAACKRRRAAEKKRRQAEEEEKRNRKTIGDIVREARERGMTYGQYVATLGER